MKFIPHEYQSYCVDFIKSHPVAALFLDMGLGLRQDGYYPDGFKRPDA